MAAVVAFQRVVKATAHVELEDAENCRSMTGFQIWNYPRQIKLLIGLRSDLRTDARSFSTMQKVFHSRSEMLWL